jgi:hypothetical protein
MKKEWTRSARRGALRRAAPLAIGALLGPGSAAWGTPLVAVHGTGAPATPGTWHYEYFVQVEDTDPLLLTRWQLPLYDAPGHVLDPGAPPIQAPVGWDHWVTPYDPLGADPHSAAWAASVSGGPDPAALLTFELSPFELEARRQELQHLHSEVARLGQEIADLEQEATELSGQISSVQAEIDAGGHTVFELNLLQQQLAVLQSLVAANFAQEQTRRVELIEVEGLLDGHTAFGEGTFSFFATVGPVSGMVAVGGEEDLPTDPSQGLAGTPWSFGESAFVPGAPVAVPEASATLLLGLAAGLATLRRRWVLAASPARDAADGIPRGLGRFAAGAASRCTGGLMGMLRARSSILSPVLVALVVAASTSQAGALELDFDPLGSDVAAKGVVRAVTGSIGSSTEVSDPVALDYDVFDDACCFDRVESLKFRLLDTSFISSSFVTTILEDDAGSPLAPTDLVRLEVSGSVTGAPVPFPLLSAGGTLVLELRQSGLAGRPPDLVRSGAVPRHAAELRNATGLAILTMNTTGQSMVVEFDSLAVPEPGLLVLLGLAFAVARKPAS